MQKSEKAMRWGLRVHLFWYVIANVAQVVVWAIRSKSRSFARP
ncbi:hypothetical protein ACGF3G_24310 [Streptomyces sp. NPDC048179]